ncbi:uncharacterized protein FSUBG_9692 [Fusarium subglutinans]|uniref:CorA-like transporter domain-containing protein n=1 Tax=Gibberella subglutinans TaxID=42677 RepID=A0A8H5PBU2_GIBSU|nr:uncharacterized protein FSUBG_9692 [Fusarium subglutinans]KAF5593784.1 hypothetical protein FSUBG_9692 [Fusarium subglutinans]
MNNADSLVDCCKQWSKYPRNLLQPCHRQSVLNDYRSRLDKPKTKLFDANRENIHFLEPNGFFSGYKETAIAGPADLEKHLGPNGEDPHYCMIFIESRNSRSPLNCSHQSFCYLSTFYQIPVSFLDFLFSFGQSTEPLDYHMTGFDGSDTLDTPQSEILQIPKLGRSGREHTVQYLLRSVEKSTERGQVVWHIRQLAVHHKFDFITGKSFWLSIKANSVVQERLKEAIADNPKFNPEPTSRMASSFAATLMTILVYLEWCDESWRECVNDLEGNIRVVLKSAETASVNHQPGLRASAMRFSTIGTATAAFGEPEKYSPPSLRLFNAGYGMEKPLAKYLPSALGKSLQQTNATPLLPLGPKTAAVPGTGTNDGFSEHPRKVLETFSVENLQHLHYIGGQLEKFRLVMLLNRQTLRDISEHYQDLTIREYFPSEHREECDRSLNSFARRVERIRRNLEIRVTQLEALRTCLQEGKTLVGVILQHRTMQAGRISTESSHSQSDKIEQMSYKAKREKVPMHIVAIVAILFLPGTFVSGRLAGLFEMDSYQLLKRSCEQWSTYPTYLLRPDQRRNALESYRLALDVSERQLFQASTEDVHIVEPSDSPDGYAEQTIANPFALRKHLEQNRKDPQASLILALICSHYQIPASFLDFVSSFGYTSEPQNYHTTGFDSYDTIENPRSNLLEIQQLGRSGLEHGVQYMLRSVEKSTEDTGNRKWEIRQMAIHHRYDFGHGKALWLNIKNDNAMSERMKEAIAEDPALNSALSKDIPGSFAASLRTHLVHLEWCDNSWREFICDKEGEIRRTLKGLKAAQSGNKHDVHSSSPTEHAGSGIQAETRETAGLQRSVSWRLAEEIEDLDKFPFREAEKLDSLFERLEQSLLVIQLNIQTLRDISDHYENLATRDNLPSEMVTRSFFSDLDSFSHRISRIQKNLEIPVTQVKSLMSWLRKERELFEEIMRYRSVQASCFFTKTSHLHLDRMQQIAHKTQEDTMSMHVITLVTLAFLPRAFVAVGLSVLVYWEKH